MKFSFPVISDRSRRLLMLSAVWITGLIFGTYFSTLIDISFLQDRVASTDIGSAAVVLITVLLPFWIAAYAVSIDQKWILFPLCLMTAGCYAFCGGILYRHFGSAGWLAQPAWQFTATACLPVLCCFLLRLTGQNGNVKRQLLISSGLCLMAAILDYALVSPFWAALD